MQSPSDIRKTASISKQAAGSPQLHGANRSLKAATSIQTGKERANAASANLPTITAWDPTSPIPQLVTIDIVCSMLSLQKSAVYDLIARGLLEPPCKLSPGRRGASRWLLSSVVKFIQQLAAQREFPAANMLGASNGGMS